MTITTEVLIVGSGPTGLMLACQLLRFGVRFKIIDKNKDRSQESRAFGIQARSMEIFQNLGIVDEFLKNARVGHLADFYVGGKLALELNFDKIKINTTPYPNIFFLPQSETERILIEFIERHGVEIDRQTSLENFSQDADKVEAVIKRVDTQEEQHVVCQYLVGCDGAHSKVRELLAIPFVGAAYQQNFFLADARVEWSKPVRSEFMAFSDSAGLFLHLPLSSGLSRVLGVNLDATKEETDQPIQIAEIEKLARKVTHQQISIKDTVWMTRFHLHHRVVNQYQKDRAFLAGDAAHIHSPVGAQGMNTGLQDATNLAWKLAGVLKYAMHLKLLVTYTAERQWVGKKLTETTDRFFWFLTSPNKILRKIRPYILTFIFKLVANSAKLQKRMFWLMSQLGIQYQPNYFLEGEKAGMRAPDAPIGLTSLFSLLKESPFSILIFQNPARDATTLDENKIKFLQQSLGDWIKIHIFLYADDKKILFKHYQIKNSGLYVIRPDGYIGFHRNDLNLDDLCRYLKKFS